MASRSRTLYIGFTGRLPTRVWQHKTHAFDGFSAKYRCERLVYYELYQDVQNAIAREKQLKKWPRATKLKLIETANPTWLDLAEDWYKDMNTSGQLRMRGD